MTPEERRARAERFRLWWEQDGMADAVQEVATAYLERMAALEPHEPGFEGKARVLAIGARVVKQVEAQIMAVLLDGALAAKEIERMERDKAFTPQKRRWI